MIKILFGVAGEGLGHAARAAIVIRHLESQGHTVKVITYHQGYWALKEEFDTHKIFGLRFAHKDGKTTYPGTVIENIKQTPEAMHSFQEIKKLIKTFQPDIIFTDLEPFSSLMAYLHKIPLVSIDNQHRITRGKIEYKKKWLLDYLLNKTGVAAVAFNAQTYIITSFFNFKITAPDTYVVPPILREEVFQAKPIQGKHILVYNTTADVKSLIKLFNQRSETFIIYGPDKNKVIGNCVLKKQSKAGFLNDVISARAIIASAGLTLMSEAIYLGKPYLALPVEKRVEQLINGYYLKKMHYGNYTEELTTKDLAHFIENIPRYRKALKKYNRTDNSKLYKLLDKLLNELLANESLLK